MLIVAAILFSSPSTVIGRSSAAAWEAARNVVGRFLQKAELVVGQAFGEVPGVGQPPLPVAQPLLVSVGPALGCGPQEGHLGSCLTDTSSLYLPFGKVAPITRR
jgi:hypothetical protein